MLVSIQTVSIFRGLFSVFRKPLFKEVQSVASEAISLFALFPFQLIIALVTLSAPFRPESSQLSYAPLILQIFVLLNAGVLGLILVATITVSAFDRDVWIRNIDASPSPFPIAILFAFSCPCCYSIPPAGDRELDDEQGTSEVPCLPGCNCANKLRMPDNAQPQVVDASASTRSILSGLKGSESISRTLVRIPNAIERRSSIAIAFERDSRHCKLINFNDDVDASQLVAYRDEHSYSMAGIFKLQLRILYTINSSPQYILARSSSLVAVVPIPPASQDNNDGSGQPKYATVSLKACLDTICRSSPELIQDNNRDYSVYVLDPLESNSAPAPMNISNSNVAGKSRGTREKQAETSCGVAVGFGLMSWALLADENDGMAVTGTQVRINTGREALEVIFALRETMAMQRTSLSANVKSWGLPLGVSPHPTRYITPDSVQGSSASASSATTTIDPNMLSLPESSAKQQSGYIGSASPTTTGIRTSRSCVLPSGSRSVDASFSARAAATAPAQARNKAKSKAKKPPKLSTTPASESDRIMYASETYIGPFKKKGRPRNASCGTVIGKDSSISNDTSRNAPGSFKSQSSADPHIQSLGESEPVDAKPVLRRDQSHIASVSLTAGSSNTPSMDLLRNGEARSMTELLNAVSNSHSTNAQNATLLAALGVIDFPNSNGDQGMLVNNQEPNPTLVNALKHLLSAYVKQASQSAVSQLPTSTSGTGTTTNPNQDDDVVILDKENVDPLAFRRRADKDLSCPKASDFRQSVRLNAAAVDSRSSGHNILCQSTGVQNNSAPQSTMKRKRTLSDFMDEKESERQRERVKEREREKRHHCRRPQTQDCKASAPTSESAFNSLRHYPRLLVGEALPRPRNNSYYRKPLEAWSSPPRPSRDLGNISDVSRPISVPDSPAPKACASSPCRVNSDRLPRKRYIVPEWARTNTTMQPRLSEEAQRAMEEAEERKRREKDAAKKKATSTHKKVKQGSKADLARPIVMQPMSECTEPETTQPTTANSSCPVFAVSDAADGLLSSLSRLPSQSSSPHSTSASSLLSIPRTPPQRRPISMFTPERGSSSLFTPTPKAGSFYLPGSTESPLFTLGKRPEPPPSPLAARNKTTKMSPIQAVISGKTVGVAGWTGGSSDNDDNDWDDLDCPPSSLPTASSDIEDDAPTSSTVEVEQSEDNSEDDLEEEQCSIRQHWVGLPPSSPPPPTSPVLTAQETDDDDMDVTALPVPTSDIEKNVLDPDVRPEFTPERGIETPKDALDSLLSSFVHPPEGCAASDADMFGQLSSTNNPRVGDNTLDSSSPLQSGLQNDLVDFDFTEFWESFKPVVEEHAGNSVERLGTTDTSIRLDPDCISTAGLDHIKLAEDVQALFGGCLI
ncbi:hypothetical protein AX17_003992 [Amanita inopinata Kibby_2008]|nr:hypothetical protein AX17_003992 [Amanita inopinata Kibby_2008]